MKILMFVTSLSTRSGGPSRSVPMMAKGLSESGVDVILLTRYSNDMNTHALDGTSVKIVPLFHGVDRKEFESLIRNEKVDIVQLQSIWTLDYHIIAQICIKTNIPYIFTPRGMLEPWSLSQNKWKKKLALMLYQKHDLNRATCIYTTSDMEAYNVKHLGINTTISVIPNGIDIDGYPCRSSKEFVKKQILFLSRIHVKKGIELLIDAWKKVRDDYPGWCIKIVGNGEDDYINKLKKKVDDSNLANCIKILPPVFGQEKVELYQTSALFVLPSYSENFGMVVAEALSCGVPVITSEYTPWQVLNDTNTGWCISLSVESLEKTLRKALNIYPEGLYEMGQKGSEMVAEKFGYRSVTAKTVVLYEWILKKCDKPDFVL